MDDDDQAEPLKTSPVTPSPAPHPGSARPAPWGRTSALVVGAGYGMAMMGGGFAEFVRFGWPEVFGYDRNGDNAYPLVSHMVPGAILGLVGVVVLAVFVAALRRRDDRAFPWGPVVLLVGLAAGAVFLAVGNAESERCIQDSYSSTTMCTTTAVVTVRLIAVTAVPAAIAALVLAVSSCRAPAPGRPSN